MSPWHALEGTRCLQQPAAVWEQRLGRWFTSFRSAFLQPGPGLAGSYPCPRDCGCAHEIVPEGPGVFAAVCRCERWNCDTFPLTAEHLTLWELSWGRLGRALCAGFGLEARPAEVPLRATRQIGSWSVAAVPVLLTLPAEALGLRRVIAELSARLRRPYILLAPTSRHLTASGLELLADAGAGFFDLASHVALTGAGALQPLKTPGELFSKFTPEPAEADRSVVERAFALVKALQPERPLREPSVVTTFSLYCLEGMSVSRIARRFGCSRGTVLNRLELIRRRTRTDPNRFRQLSPQFARMEEELSDSRARSIYRKGAVYGEEGEDS